MARPPFPWHYYARAVRSRFFWAAISCALTVIASKIFPESFFAAEALILLGLFIAILFFCLFRVRPMRAILERTFQLQEKLPHERNLELLYRKNEFQLIEEILELAEKQLMEERELFENKSLQTDTALEYIPNAVVVVDRFKNCLRTNRCFEEKFVQGKEVFGVTEKKLWKVFTEREILDTFELALTSKEPKKLLALKKDQEYYDITVTPVFNNKKESIGALGIFHNVTSSKLTEKMRVDFVANVSHEIRTPLTSIKGYSQFLQANKDELPEALRPALDKINANTERLKDLFDNLLRLSVIESKEELQKEDLNFASFIKNVSTNLKGKWLKKSFEVVTLGEGHIFGDSKLLEQLFTNLIDNAIKYSDKERTQVEFKLTTGADYSTIQVRDNGSGFSKEEGERIFERFYRVQGQSDRPIEGSGLGLSIVKHIVQKHKGSIEVDSIKGSGSTFTVRLPTMP